MEENTDATFQKIITSKDIEISVTKKETGNILALVNVTILGIIEIHGFTVRSSDYQHDRLKEFVQVLPPCIKGGSHGWRKVVFIKDQQIWETIEYLIFNEYQKVAVFKNEDTIKEIRVPEEPPF